MIDNDEVGQKILNDLIKYLDDGSINYSEWEQGFLTRLRGAPYKWLTDKQKSAVGRLYDTKVLQR